MKLSIFQIEIDSATMSKKTVIIYNLIQKVIKINKHTDFIDLIKRNFVWDKILNLSKMINIIDYISWIT